MPDYLNTKDCTPGPWQIQSATTGKSLRGKTEIYHQVPDGKREIVAWPYGGRRTTEPNTIIIAEAGTVAHETGKGPRQLADELDDAVELLRYAKSRLEYKHDMLLDKAHIEAIGYIDRIDALLAKHKPSNNTSPTP